MKTPLKFLATILALAIAGHAHAGIVLDDHFDDGTLGTNTSGVGGGFVVNSSQGTNTSTVTEGGTTVSIDEDDEDADGIASDSGFDLSTGVTATWQVSSLTLGSSGANRRSFYGLQDADNTWMFNSGSTAIGIELDPVNNEATLRLQSGASQQTQATQALTNQVTESNYTITAIYTTAGYTITSTGLGDEINLSGSWDAAGDFTFANLFGSGNLHASAYLQANGSVNSSTGNLTIDRIQLDTVAVVPAPAALPTGLALLTLAAGRRRQ